MAADPAAQTITDDDIPGAEPAESAAARTPPGGKDAPADARQPAPKKYTHSSRLTKLALDLGFSQQDLDKFPSDAIWEEIDRIRGTTQPQRAEPAKPEPKAPPADPDEEYLSELEKVDPQLAKLMRRAIAKDDLKPIQEKLEKLDRLEAAEQQRQARAVTRALDDAFAALPEKFAALVGEGPIEELTDPGQKGWRGAIYQAAKIQPGDGRKAIAQKIAAAAEAVAGSRVKDAPADPYAAAAARPAKPTPPRDPGNGRFTVPEFNGGLIHRPNGKQTGADPLDDKEQARRYFKDHGDPRGNAPRLEVEDDDLPE